jgi:hypothetical protein
VALADNTYTYNVGAGDVSIVVPDGQYSFKQLATYLSNATINNGDKVVLAGITYAKWEFVLNDSTQRAGVLIRDAATTVIFAVDSELLGFTAQTFVYTDGVTPTYGTNGVDITLGVTDIQIQLPGFVQATFLGDVPSYAIYSFVPKSKPGHLFEDRPERLQWHKVTPTVSMNAFNVKLTDQLGRQLVIQDSDDNPTHIELIFRRILSSQDE